MKNKIYAKNENHWKMNQSDNKNWIGIAWGVMTDRAKMGEWKQGFSDKCN